MIEQEPSPDGNPQGKGLVPVLDALKALRPFQPEAKSGEQILRDFCLSTLVLSASFDFRAVPGQTYYLYRLTEGWNLSLISPVEWGQRCPGPYVGHCELAIDMTWTLVLAENLGTDGELLDALEAHLAGFIDRVTQAGRLEDALPIYESGLPYQQRMMATALSTSLQTSLLLSGLNGVSGAQLLSQGQGRQFFLGVQSTE